MCGRYRARRPAAAHGARPTRWAAPGSQAMANTATALSKLCWDVSQSAPAQSLLAAFEAQAARLPPPHRGQVGEVALCMLPFVAGAIPVPDPRPLLLQDGVALSAALRACGFSPCFGPRASCSALLPPPPPAASQYSHASLQMAPGFAPACRSQAQPPPPPPPPQHASLPWQVAPPPPPPPPPLKLGQHIVVPLAAAGSGPLSISQYTALAQALGYMPSSHGGQGSSWPPPPPPPQALPLPVLVAPCLPPPPPPASSDSGGLEQERAASQALPPHLHLLLQQQQHHQGWPSWPPPPPPPPVPAPPSTGTDPSHLHRILMALQAVKLHHHSS